MSVVLYSHFIFIFILGNVISTTFMPVKFEIEKYILPNIYISIFIILLLYFFLYFGISGENIFISGAYNSGETAKSSMHEYSILFYILSYFFTTSSRFEKFATNSFFILFIFKTLIYGGRIEVLEIILVYLYFNYILSNKIKIRIFLIILLLGFYFISIIGELRNNPTILFNDNFFSIFNPLNLFKIPNSGDMISTTEGDVVQSSSRIIGLINTQYLDLFTRFNSFVSFLSSAFVSNVFLPEYSNLSTYKQQIFTSGGGGLISTYFFCWMWYFGPFVIAFSIGYIINKFFKYNSAYFFIYGFSLLITFPRWFSYNPIFIIKFCFFSILLYLIFVKCDSLFFKRKKYPL